MNSGSCYFWLPFSLDAESLSLLTRRPLHNFRDGVKHWLRKQYYLLEDKVKATVTDDKFFGKFNNDFWRPEDMFGFEWEDAITCECPIE